MAPSRKLIAEQLASFATGLDYGVLSDDIVTHTKMAVLDQLGCQLLGSTLEWNQAPYRLVKDFEGRRESTVINFGTMTLRSLAGYVNAVFGQGAELDDYGAGVGAHSGATSVSSALAICEADRLSGKDFITAINIGYDIAWGLGSIMHQAVLDRGFHPHPVISVFAVAGLAGRLLGLSESELVQAFSIAGSLASGTVEYSRSGGEVKRLHSGLAARGGIEAAMLASYGLTGPVTIFEGEWGIFRTFGGIETSEQQTLSLSEGVGILHNCLKKYPTPAVAQSPIDILSRLIATEEVGSDDVSRIDLFVGAGIIDHCGQIYSPTQTIQAQFSLPFSLAITLVRRSNDLALYMDQNVWTDPEVLSATKKVFFHADPSLLHEKYQCRLRVTLKDGRVLEEEARYPKGSYRNPFTTEEIYAKFRRIAAPTLPNNRIESVIETVVQLDQVDDMSKVASLLVP